MKEQKVTKEFSDYIFNSIFRTGKFSKIEYNNGFGFLIENENSRYEIRARIGYFLNGDNQKLENDRNFDYLTHYKFDAEAFDYFEKRFGETAHDERRLREYIISEVPEGVHSILDAGCGRAWVAERFCSVGVNVCSLDVAPKNVEEALSRYNYSNHCGIVSDLLNMPFPENFFDCIICSEVIEHIVEPKKLINELLRCVKIGGIILLSTPYRERINYVLCIHCNRKTPINAHLHSFDENSLLDFFSDMNIKGIKFYLFGNKFLQYIRHHVILKFFPFLFWKYFDRFFNLLYKKQSHILVKIIKGG